MKNCNDYGQKPSGDMSQVKGTANGNAKPENIGKSVKPADPSRGASGEMSKVRSIASKPAK